LVSNASLSILPQLKPGNSSPIALAYSVPVTELDFYYFTPKLSGNLFTWFGADLYPQYFLSIRFLAAATNPMASSPT